MIRRQGVTFIAHSEPSQEADRDPTPVIKKLFVDLECEIKTGKGVRKTAIPNTKKRGES